MNLLIVDDNATIREMIKSLFADLADQIYESENGQEAIDSYARHHQDWVLMDIEMPVCDGLAATRRIKEGSPDARIIVVTSYDSKVLRQAAIDAGACAYVLKDDLSNIHDMIKANKGAGSATCGGDSNNFLRSQLNFFRQFLSFDIGLVDSSTM
jgi:CheY-like chemotaxis protein